MGTYMKLFSRVVPISLLAIFSSCDDKKQQMNMPPPMIGSLLVVKKDVPLNIEVPAKITGSLEIQIRSQVGGILKSRTYNEGQYVHQGDKLFEIDPAQYKASLSKAQGALAQAQSEVRRTSRDYERMRKLHKAAAISQKEHDDSLSALERAQANLKVAEGALKEAEINLGYTDVRAPISGIVRKEAQSVGSLISPAGESSLLTSMVQVCPLHAIFSVSGALWTRLAQKHISGQVRLVKFDDYKVEVYMSDGTKYSSDGKIIFVDSSEDSQTSSVSIKAEIPSSEHQNLLLPGQFVRIKLIGAMYKDALVIPSAAVISTTMGPIVYVVNKENEVEARPVNVEVVGNRAIIYNGLSEGENVIFEGIIKARPGQKVNAVLKQDVAAS